MYIYTDSPVILVIPVFYMLLKSYTYTGYTLLCTLCHVIYRKVGKRIKFNTSYTLYVYIIILYFVQRFQENSFLKKCFNVKEVFFDN